MASCPHVPTCRLFPIFTLRTALRVWQMSYCERSFDQCARYQKACTGEGVPDNLLPSGDLLDLGPTDVDPPKT
jgi:hypothetical protein